MIPFFNRAGSKRLMSDEILSMFPSHTTYVEPFIGGGALFWKKPQAAKSVINDLDKKLIEGYRSIKSASSDIKKYPKESSLQTLEQLKRFLEGEPYSNPERRVVGHLIRNNSGFSGRVVGKSNKVYGLSNPHKRIKNIDKYKKILKTTTILNKDWKDVIKKYDGKGVLFYLDPPYEGSEGIYKDESINFEEMAAILKKIKGKFVLSINDSPRIRRIFKGFKIKKIKLKTRAPRNPTERQGLLGTKKRTELIIRAF